MRTYLWILAGLKSLLLAACGSPLETNLRQVGLGGLDAEGVRRVAFTFRLPDRQTILAKDLNAVSSLNTFYYRIEGRGPRCPEGELFEAAGPYKDQQEFELRLTDSCDYSIDLRLGEGREQAAALTSNIISYAEHIQPLISRSCVSCHASFNSYQGVLASAEDIILAVENRSMPPESPLSIEEIASVLAWADGGYEENIPDSASSTLREQSLARIYYRNNFNDQVMAYELLGRNNFELRRSLWLQEAGQTAGLTTRQLYTFDDSTR